MTRPQLLGRRRPVLLGELVVVLFLLRVYDFVRGHAEVRAHAALVHGRAVLHLEAALHLDLERALNRWAAQHDLVAYLSSHWYEYAHIPVTLSVLAWVWVRHPDGYRGARTALVLINLIGLAVFLLLPVAPPRLLTGAGFTDLVAQAGFGSDHSGPVRADQYGAMPSLHLAWAVWSTVVVRRVVRRPRLRRAWLAYPMITTGVVVVTGNHFLLDAVAGTLVALLVLTFVRPGPAGLAVATVRRARALRAAGAGSCSPAAAPGGGQRVGAGRHGAGRPEEHRSAARRSEPGRAQAARTVLDPAGARRGHGDAAGSEPAPQPPRRAQTTAEDGAQPEVPGRSRTGPASAAAADQVDLTGTASRSYR